MAIEDAGTKLPDSEALAEECEALDGLVTALKIAYEQYFLGLERQPPVRAHSSLKTRMTKLRNAFTRQTALKFRIQQLHTKFVSYERLWARTLQEMENGTYRRDVFKMRLHSKKEVETEPALAAKPVAPAAATTAKPNGAPPNPAQGAPRPTSFAANAAGGLSEAKLKAVYEAYVTAKKRCQEDVSKLTYEAVAANLRKQVPELMKKHNASGVDFKVVIKDGKAMLRALPKS